MKCTPIQLDIGGQTVTAIVCGSGRTKLCQHPGCRGAGVKLCDWKVPEGGTCDMRLCVQHASQPAPGKDLCPTHTQAWAARQANMRKIAK